MLNKEYKVLKCIYKHPDVSFKNLKNKFPKFEIEQILRRIDDYIAWSKMEESQDDNGIYTGNYHFVNDSTFAISRSGEEFIEKKQHDFWLFFLPYAITTLIAISGVILDILTLCG